MSAGRYEKLDTLRTRIVIVGAGGFGRGVYSWIMASPQFRAAESVEEIVFIDDQVLAVSTGAPVIATVDNFVPRSGDKLICAIGAPEIRRRIVGDLLAREAEFISFWDDTCVIGAEAGLGKGIIICPGTVISSDVLIGDFSHINMNCSIGHDVAIGTFVTLSPACNVTGGVHIEDDAFLGASVTIIPGVVVSKSAYIGAGSIVVEDVPPRVVSFGNPSRTVRTR